MKKAWKRTLAAVLTAGMVLSLLPGWALAAESPDPPVGATTIHEYVEVTGEEGLTSGGVYAIAAPNDKILYHIHDGHNDADQVDAGSVIGTKLFLNKGFPERCQTWILTGDPTDGYSLKSNAENDTHYLHMDGTTNPGIDRIPVVDTPEPFTFTWAEDGWVISREIDAAATYYLAHNDSGHYYVSADTQTHFRIYKQQETTLYVPSLPGYTLVTDKSGSDLRDDQYYMFVGKGANGEMYALLPGDGTNSTDAPQPNLTAKLTVSEDGASFTAEKVSDHTPISNLDTLLFRSFHYSGGSDTFASANKTGRLLSLQEYMFTDVAGSISVTVGPYGRVTLHAGNGRYLGLNIRGDATSSLEDQATGFYGPTAEAGCPIYLFTKDDAEVPDINLEIPGYHRITSTTQLEIGSEYMLVSADSYGDLYALYPASDGVGMLPGDAIDPDPAKHASYTSLTAQLTVDREAPSPAVSAQYLKTDGTAEPISDMGDLHFTVERTGSTFTVKYREDLYLAMVDDHFFTETPTELSITPDTTLVTSIYPPEGKFQIKDLHSGRNNARILDFNVKGGPIQFVSGSGDDIQTFQTNFWGPRFKRYPIYIYEYAGTPAPDTPAPTPERDRLQTLVTKWTSDAYTPRSWEDFFPVLTSAQDLLRGDPDEEACKAARVALRDAEDRLVPIASLLDEDPFTGGTDAHPFTDGVGPADPEDPNPTRNFRSPSLVTLPDGALAAAADARWDHAYPARGIDTAFSYSTDSGANWRYSFPNYFADSANGENAASAYAAAFTDPVMAAKGNEVYLLTTLFPGGVALRSAPKTPANATGFASIGGKQRLLVYTNNIDKTQTDSNYTYYVGDFVDGCADLYDAGGSQTLYYVDASYNLYRRAYTAGAEKVPADDRLHCRQWEGDDPYGAKYVQQNLFFYNSDFHVRSASYLWLRKGTYEGGTFTWSAPTLLNPQVRTAGDGAFFGAAPGRGTVVTKDGTDAIVLPTYLSSSTADSERAGVITSADGADWSKGASLTDAASQAVPVAVGDTLYLFPRGNNSYYVSTDSGATWSAAKATGASYNTDCQLSAIHYSRKLGGRDAVILSAATDAGGKLFLFLVEEDGDLTLKKEYQVTAGYFDGSCLTELASGDLGLLYESSAWDAKAAGSKAALTFVTVPKEELIPAPVDVSLTVGESKTFTVPADSGLTNSDAAVVTADVADTTLTLTGAKAGTAEVVADDIYLYRVTVTAADRPSDSGGSSRPSHTQAPADPVADCPRDVTCPIAAYTDADPKAWYHDGVHYCIDASLMAGYGNGHWGPGDSLTRAMLVQLLYNKAGKPAVTGAVPFTDVDPAAWYADAITWGAAEGIVEGYGDGTFAPEQPVSRQDAVVILYRYAGSPAAKETALDPFSDADTVGPWAVEALGWAVEQKLILGKGDSILAPQHHASRAEAAAILHRHFGGS